MWARRFVLVGLLVVSMAPPAGAAEPLESDAGLTALFVRYYSAIAQGRWSDAFQLLHDRLKAATEVHSPEELAQKSSRSQQELIDAFKTFDRLEVARTAMDLMSIKGHVKSSGNGNIAGVVTYDLVVFPKGPGHPLMYRVVMDVGLAGGRIIRITQHSITRIDPGGFGDAI
jgi:hypothetical protein